MRTIKPPPKRLPSKPDHLPAPTSTSSLPATAPDGTIMVNAAKYAKSAVLTAFEMIGGTEELAKWGRQNRGEFYTKLFTKTIQKDFEVGSKDDVESLLDKIDAHQQKKLEDEMTIDAEFEMVGDAYGSQSEG